MSVIGNVIYAGGGGSGGVSGLGNCLTFTSLSSFTLEVNDHTKHWDGALEWTDGTNEWATWDGTTTLSASEGFLAIRGTGNSVVIGAINSSYKWSLSGSNIQCDGNLETLLDYATVAAGNHPQIGAYSFFGLFDKCVSLITAPSLLATTLANECCERMFYGCTSLTTASELSATTLAPYCYAGMFSGCTSLTSAPALPATTLANGCYHQMFSGCTSLKSAPALPATTLANGCYSGLFQNCTSLKSAPVLPATTLENECYGSMFHSCTSLTTAPTLPATTLASYCYNAMFWSCTSLKAAPSLPATTLATSCYSLMFWDCTSLTTAPALPATTLAKSCYNQMFLSCTSLRMSQSQGGDYQYAYRIPTTGSGTTATSALDGMFGGTGGAFTGTPSINTTYYTTKQPIG